MRNWRAALWSLPTVPRSPQLQKPLPTTPPPSHAVCPGAKPTMPLPGRNAHGHAAPAGHGGEFPSAFHGFADIAEVIRGAGVNGNRFAGGSADGAGRRHAARIVARR